MLNSNNIELTPSYILEDNKILKSLEVGKLYLIQFKSAEELEYALNKNDINFDNNTKKT